MADQMERDALISRVEAELQQVDHSLFPESARLLEAELFRLKGGVSEWADVISNRKIKIRCKVVVPIEQYPHFNFVGKLLGQNGTTFKNLQELTMTKMAILGSGSMRNPSKEQEALNTGDSKYWHLRGKLHVQIDSLAEPAEAYYRMSHALAEVKKAMTPEEGLEIHAASPAWGIGPAQDGMGTPGGYPVGPPRGGGMFRGGRGGQPLMGGRGGPPMGTGRGAPPPFRGRGGGPPTRGGGPPNGTGDHNIVGSDGGPFASGYDVGPDAVNNPFPDSSYGGNQGYGVDSFGGSYGGQDTSGAPGQWSSAPGGHESTTGGGQWSSGPPSGGKMMSHGPPGMHVPPPHPYAR